ncbi:uncharacterized protein LOC143276099 [Babylonia areolata]|uniref:uncharacterized protein LOC143276099 n=1 Tax=Babylonia areolata TaxID=304850 RepID=UPI003FD1B9FD
MSTNLMNESGDSVPLTSVPVVLSADNHMTHILELTGSNQLVDTSYDSEDLPPSSAGTTQSGDSGMFPVLLQTSNGCIRLMQSVNDSKPEVTLLQPVHEANVTSTASPLILSKEEASFNKAVLTVSSAPSEPGLSKPVTSLQSSLELQDVSSLTDSLDGKPLGLTEVTETGKVEDGSVMSSAVSPSSVSLLKADSGTSALPMGLSEAGDAYDMEPAATDKPAMSPTSIFPEGAVLVETPQGLMLSVGDELRAVTLMEGPDSQGNHLLSISNNGIPVALLSQCQSGGLLEDQEGVGVYQASRDGEVEGDGTVVSSSDLSLGTQQVLSVSAPQEAEPKRKNRGWPKGKKRKPAPLVTGPRAPMTGYVLFAINRRQEIKQSHPDLPFSEVTKVLGQEWSSMPMDKKQKFLDEAENDKQRYIDELKQLQKSEIYQTLVKKRRTNVDDAKDDTDNDIEDDGDELHCRVCKLYFSSLHNKKEHLLGKQHLQAITDQLKKGMKKQQKEQEAEVRDPLVGMEVSDLGGDNSALFLNDSNDGSPSSHQCSCWTNPVNVSGAISDFVHRVFERDQEIFKLRRLLRKHSEDKFTIYTQLQELKDYEGKLQQELRNLSAHTSVLTDRINTLKMVPALFGVEELS